MNIQIDLRQVVYALSDALDLVGVDDFHHGKRVALMAAACGRVLGLDPSVVDTLFDAGLIHDCGVSSTRVHQQLVTELDWEGSQEHCDLGDELLSGFAPLAPLAPLVRHHHTHWDALSGLGLPEDTALFSNLIYLVDRVDALAAPHYGQPSLLFYKEEIRATIANLGGTYFAPRLVDAFLAASRNEAFWLRLEPRHIQQSLQDMIAPNRPSQEIGFEQLRQMALLFSRIVDAKSPFTVEHSLGVATLARLLGERLGLSAETCDKLEIAGLLHDLGKLQIPDEILEKPAGLDPKERAAMNRHSFETYQILRRIPGLEDIAHWAAYHHEAPDGEGYPFHRRGSELSLEARLVAVADIFQAMAQKRPYRDALPAEEILRHLRKLATAGHLDTELVDLVEQNLDACRLAAGRLTR